MTVQELIEAAQLDVLGLLDHDEQREFEAAFRAAAPALQAQIRAEQARAARAEMLAPGDEPSPALRERVLARLRAEIRAQSESVAGVISEGRIVMSAPAGINVSPAWRAAALGFATAAAVLLGAFLYVLDANEKASQQVARDSTIAAYSTGYGAPFYRQSVFDGRYERHLFKPVATGTVGAGAAAAIHAHPDWDHVKLFIDKLEAGPNQTLRLCVVDEQNRIVLEVAELTPSAGQPIVNEIRGLTLKPGLRLAVVAAGPGEKAAPSGVLMVTTI